MPASWSSHAVRDVMLVDHIYVFTEKSREALVHAIVGGRGCNCWRIYIQTACSTLSSLGMSKACRPLPSTWRRSFRSPWNGNDFVTYGEQLVVLTQNILIVALFWYYLPTTEKPSILFMLSVATTIFGSGFGLLYGLPPMLWWILPICSSVFNIMSRIPQIATNFANKHTGRLSVITWFLQVGGSLEGFFTNLQERH